MMKTMYTLLLVGAAGSLLDPTDPEFIPPFRDERFVEFIDSTGTLQRLALMLNSKVRRCHCSM